MIGKEGLAVDGDEAVFLFFEGPAGGDATSSAEGRPDGAGPA